MVDLTKAEQNIKDYIIQGMSNKEIAELLFVSEKTVKFHLTNIYKKLDVINRTKLVAKHNYTLRKVNDMSETLLPTKENPLSLQSQDIQKHMSTQKERINFVDEKFMVGDSIKQLHYMMKEVTKEQINPNTVMAACNCVSRINETINTAIQAARFLAGK